MHRKLSRRSVIKSGGALALTTGGVTAAIPAASANLQETIEIRAAGFVESQEQLQHTVDVLARYEEANPNVSINPEYTDYSSYTTKLATEAAGGNAPDMMSSNGTILSEYSQRGVLLALDDLVAGTIDLGDYAEGTVAGNRIDDVLYGIPNDCISPSLIYNADMLASAGIPVPDPMWTWEAFEQLATDLSAALGDGVYGTEDRGAGSLDFDIFLRARGKNFFGPERTLGFEEADLADWYGMWQRLRESGGAPPGEVQALSSTDDLTRMLLVTGQAAMLPMLTDAYFGLQALTEASLGIHFLPNGFNGGELKQQHYAYAGNSTSVWAESDHVETVIDIIRFMHTDPQGVATFYQGSGLIPPSAAGRAELLAVASEGEKTIMTYIDQVLESPAHPRFPSISGISGILGRMNEEVAFGRLSVQEAAENFFVEAEQAMR